ncbi:FK506-binding protein 2 [Lamellibrachia satsuma]|nr:FK506-binding protein 2 [Lamellibrachia satsuma]
MTRATCSLSLFVFCYMQAVVGSSERLEIVVEYKPDDCTEFADIGDLVEVHYTGSLDATGEVFDTSRAPNRKPLRFVLGQRKVIPGWEKGINGMCVGEKRKLIIPPHLAYGSEGFLPRIPPDSTLVFYTELMSLGKRTQDNTTTSMFWLLILPLGGVVVLWYIIIKCCKRPAAQKEKKAIRRKKRQ